MTTTTTTSVERRSWRGWADKANNRSGLIAVIFGALGIAAIVEPAVAGLTVTMLVGWILVLAAFANAVSAFGAESISRVAWQAIVATIYFVGGISLIMNPLLGLGALTLLLATILFAEAISEVVAFVQAPRDPGAPWLLVNGLVTTILGMMICVHWPSSSIWAIGTLLGVNLLMTGVARFFEGSPQRIGFVRP